MRLSDEEMECMTEWWADQLRDRHLKREHQPHVSEEAISRFKSALQQELEYHSVSYKRTPGVIPGTIILAVDYMPNDILLAALVSAGLKFDLFPEKTVMTRRVSTGDFPYRSVRVSCGYGAPFETLCSRRDDTVVLNRYTTWVYRVDENPLNPDIWDSFSSLESATDEGLRFIEGQNDGHWGFSVFDRRGGKDPGDLVFTSEGERGEINESNVGEKE